LVCFNELLASNGAPSHTDSAPPLNRNKKEFLKMTKSGRLFPSVAILFLVSAFFPSAIQAVASTPAFVQERDNQVNSGNTGSTTFSSVVTGGNLLVAYLIWDSTGGASVSDSLGNVYASAGGPTRWSNGIYSAQVFYAINNRSGVDTVTAIFSTSVHSFGIIYAHEYSGINQTSPLDVTIAAAGPSGNLTSGVTNTTNSMDLLFAGGVSANVVTSPGPGYMARSTSHGNITEDRVVTVTGSYNATATNSGGAWGMQFVAFRGASNGTSGTDPNNGSLNTYSTNFPHTENPISEGGNWINGKAVGLDWLNVQTTPGHAFGGGTSTATPYNDPTAVLTGSWSSNQKAQAVVHTVNQNRSIYEEVELRLRTTISAHSITGYEFNFRATSDGSQYVQIVRWNGPFGNFTFLDSKTGPGLHDGDVVTATAVGSTLTSYINGVQIVQVTDSTYASGSPGMGFYNQGGTLANNSDFGFTSYTATDNLTSDTVPPSAPTNLAASVISSSQINLSWGASTDNVGVVGYHVNRNSTQIGTTATPNFSDSTVVPGVQYTYSVSAYDAAGNISALSSPVIAQTSPASDVTPPSVPTNLQASNVTSTTLKISWTASTDDVAVAGYQVFRNGAKVATTTTTSYTDTGLAPSATYTYAALAYDSSNNLSGQSAQLTVTTAAAAVVSPSMVQTKNNQISSGTSVSVPFNAPTQAGNTIVVYVIWNNAGSVALTDSNGNAYVNVGTPVVWGNGYSAQVFYASHIKGGSDTVTATFRNSVTAFGVLYVHEYAGISPTNPVDIYCSASGSSTTLNSGTATTTGANDLIFGAGVSDNVVTAPGSGFISHDRAYGNITEDRIAGSAGSYAATATHNGKMWGMQMVAFRPAQ
jgi:chitodextrinase